MIFVTVGTHEQPFNRLLKCIDQMVEDGIIKEKVIVQKGFTNYEFKNCENSELIEYDDMQKYIKEARIVITHGGPASFVSPLAIGKTPIVFPRKKEFNEHVNDHQVDFAREVEARMGNIIVAEDEQQLIDAVKNYDTITKKMKKGISSNNKKFVDNLQKEIEKII